jgi:tetratricopeptide (TPR) repeat protein
MNCPSPVGRLRIGIAVWIIACAMLAWHPSVAMAQKDAFVDGLLELGAAAAGTFGDEGPEIHQALEKMTDGLMGWAPPALPDASRGASVLEGRVIDEPLMPPVAYLEGYRVLLGGDVASGLAALRRAADADPLTADPAAGLDAMRLAAGALREGRLEEARRHLEAALEIAPRSSEARRGLGLVYWAAGRHDASLGQLELAVQANPLNERARIARARVLMDAGRVEDAGGALRDTLDEFPGSPLAHWWLGWVLERLQDISGARAHLEAAAEATPAGRGSLYQAVGRLTRIEGDFTAALVAFEHAVEARPGHVASRKNLALAYLEQDRADEALRELNEASRLVPRDADVHAAVGRIHLDAGRHQEAVGALVRAIELAPGDAAVRYALAVARQRLGDAEGAAREMAAYEDASTRELADRRRTMGIDVLIEEAMLRTAEGWHDRAAELWRQVVERDPDNPAHHRGFAAALQDAGRAAEASAESEKAAVLERRGSVR